VRALHAQLAKLYGELAAVHAQLSCEATVYDEDEELLARLNRPRRRLRRSKRPCMAPAVPGVYVFGGQDNHVKIGRANNIQVRFRQLQCASPIPLEFIAMLSNDPEDEVSFHERFAEYRQLGEWFRLEGALRDHLESLRSSEP
jgi:hypothetical protein